MKAAALKAPAGGAADWPARIYDRVYSHSHQVKLERWVVKLSAMGFLLHLALILLSRSLPHAGLFAAIGRDYLAAIYTPFSIILFYEVVILIAAIPQSAVQAVTKQFEIVSLIFIRGFFKDIPAIDDVGTLRQPAAAMLPILTEACAGLLMFLLVTVFQHVSLGRERADAENRRSPALRLLIARKKGIALALTVWLVGLALYSAAEFARDSYNVVFAGAAAKPETTTLFYADVFTAMIFTDVLILILSLVVSDRYELVFRNAAFVISTILIRFSLGTDRPHGALLALLGMVFGIAAMLIYSYSAGLRAGDTGKDSDNIAV